MNKIYIFSFCIFLLISLNGCKSINTEMNDLYIHLDDYINFNGNKCIEYINNDITLSERQKEVYRARHRSMIQLLDSYKEKIK